LLDRPDTHRAHDDPWRGLVESGAYGPRVRNAAEGRSARGIVLQISARVFRRTTAAHRDRALPDAQARHPYLRRVGVGARRLGAGAGVAPAAGLAGRVSPFVYLYLARSRGCEVHLRSGDGHESGGDHRDRRLRRDLPPPAAAVYEEAALGDTQGLAPRSV